ncbi:CheY-like superfamily protein [Tribonema minus]|uniref:CheY-like superfamily protein n=1 Tax=Tribonema minus TaxID=303371 RepID=A0A836CI54_9STRA|nr:CheY-like superfamily protein [Tribonema minus]
MSHIRVLIVDDVMIFRKLLRKQLERRGVEQIDEAQDGIQALDIMKLKTYDVVIMDVMMPRMNGDVCVRAIREWEIANLRPKTPVILMSADVLSPDNDVLSSGAAQQFFTKPLNIVRLGNALRDVAMGSSHKGDWIKMIAKKSPTAKKTDEDTTLEIV